jgi:CII-binding regulator of phage lambda lysogenization HflD
MEIKNKLTYDERRKILLHEVEEEIDLYGKKEYGKTRYSSSSELTEEGIKAVVKTLLNQKKGLTSEITKQKEVLIAQENQLKEAEKSLKKVSKDLEDIKKQVGSRINFEKIEKKESKEKEK